MKRKTNMKGKKRNKNQGGKSGTIHNPNGERHWIKDMSRKQRVNARLAKVKKMNDERNDYQKEHGHDIMTYSKLCGSYHDPSKYEAEKEGWI